MLITIKNKVTLIIDNFTLKCSVGKNGIKKNKVEGDKTTPKGLFSIGKLYYRADRVQKPKTKMQDQPQEGAGHGFSKFSVIVFTNAPRMSIFSH